MKHTILIMSFLLAAALAAGCSSKNGKSASESKDRENAAKQLEKAKTETKEAAQAARDYAYAEKDEFVAKMKKELAEIQNELDQLSAKVDKSNGEVKAEAENPTRSGAREIGPGEETARPGRECHRVHLGQGQRQPQEVLWRVEGLVGEDPSVVKRQDQALRRSEPLHTSTES